MKMIRTIRPPESKQTTTLLVAVKCRPLTSKEQNRARDILRVVDDKVVVVLDPDSSKEYLDRIQNRTKEKKYAFDIAFGSESRNKDVYNVTVRPMIEGVIRGLNATVFAYGATGSGKTHTMAGTVDDPGLMVLSLQEIFALISKQEYDYEFEVTCSYLEVYNEVIYDLLEKSSGHLELREDPDQGITVAGLKRIQVNSSEKILELLHVGNSRRKTESTNANATSSRSHAVLEIIVKRKQRNQYRSQVLRGKLALVDLAGSERASETNNAGQKLRDGANINRSLLALANCINALGKQQKKGMAYVPYRNSKLTRLLKDGLSGNSRTIMVANVSCSEDQYHHTINTLKYADRAKEIKTHIQMNVGTVDAHVADYQRMIDNLQVEVSHLRRELAEKDTQLSARTPEKTDDQLSWLDVLSQDINENVEERINLQKALFEIEDMNLQNRTELQQLDEMIAQHRGDIDLNGSIEELVERRQVILDNIRDNDEAGAHYRQDIENNEMHRKELQQQIDEAISSNRNKTYLRILSQYRLLGMTNMELQFQMAIRDQIIQDQREALNNMWRLLESSGLNHDQILEVAAQQGIMIEEGMPHGTIPPPGRYSNLMHIPQNMEITRDSNSPSLHSSTPPKSPKVEWKQVENGAISSAMSTSSGLCASPLSNVKIQATSGNSNKDLSPERFREICRQVLLESGVLGRIDCHQPGREASCSCLSRSRSPSAQLARKMAPTTKHRRKLRASDSRLQHEVFDGSTTGVDAGSESSETEDSDHGMNNSYGRQLHRTDGGSIQPIVDTKMLQKKLSRLDHELKDLKRGMGMSSGTNGYSEPRLTSRNNEMSPVYSNRGNQYPESAPTKSHGSYVHRNDSSQKGTSPIIDKKGWGRLDLAGGDKVTSRVFLFSPPELVDGRALINLRTKALADRLPSIHARQLWTA